MHDVGLLDFVRRPKAASEIVPLFSGPPLEGFLETQADVRTLFIYADVYLVRHPETVRMLLDSGAIPFHIPLTREYQLSHFYKEKKEDSSLTCA